MKKVLIPGERKAGLVEVPDLQPKQDWAVVKVHVAPMCTEYKGYLAGQANQFLGHEAVGAVRPQPYLAAISIAPRLLVQPVRMAAQRLQLAQHDLVVVALQLPAALL